MSSCDCHHHAPVHDPVQCIIPPHIARRLSENSDPRVRDKGLALLSHSARLRGRRDAAQGFLSTAMGVGKTGKSRTIYDAGGEWDLPGRVIYREGDDLSGITDPVVIEALEGLGATYDLFFHEFGRNSIDGKGMPIDATVHYGHNFNNAQWDGLRMIFGDGDKALFNRFTVAVDVIGHELAHGVTGATARLVYRGESGALNEHMSDVFGIMVKQRLRKHDAKTSNWLIGEGILGPDIDQGSAIRSMIEPGSAYHDDVLGVDPQPAHMNQYVKTEEDSGGVHINSGIPNRAFCIAAQRLGGYAWSGAGQIWYHALRLLEPTAGFEDLAGATARAAATLFPDSPGTRDALIEAWDAVGVRIPSLRPATHRKTRESGARDDRHRTDKIVGELAVKVMENAIGMIQASFNSPAR